MDLTSIDTICDPLDVFSSNHLEFILNGNENKVYNKSG